jgi:hypothetical protein
MNWLKKAYWWFWYHVESLWIEAKELRRPFTYMMRDFWAEHKVWGWSIFLTVTALIFLATWWNWTLGGFLMFFHGALFAHLWWGEPHVPGQQEQPPYIEPGR